VGVLFEVVRAVENIAKKNGLTKIEKLVLEIGELSSMIPRYIEACYPAAVVGTMLQDTKLEIVVMPGNGICRKCSKVFNVKKNGSRCPKCGSDDWELLCGKEFIIKEIIAL
jgi:hydrogenase nickel incorporation protein HypA/HybF